MQMKTRKSSEILMYLSIIFKYVLRDEVVRMYNCTFMYMHCTKFLQEKCRDRRYSVTLRAWHLTN